MAAVVASRDDFIKADDVSLYSACLGLCGIFPSPIWIISQSNFPTIARYHRFLGDKRTIFKYWTTCLDRGRPREYNLKLPRDIPE